MRPLSLKTKMVLYIMLFFMIMAPTVAYFSLKYYRDSVVKSIEEQQFLLVTRIAEELDQKIIFAQNALASAARGLRPRIVANPSRAEEFLYNNLSLQSIFDNGVFIFSASGKMISETAVKPARTGMDFSFREYIRYTVATRSPTISPPFISSMSHRHPAVMFTSPVFDNQGTMVAILGGSIDLMKPNFLGALSQAKIGENGYFFLTTGDRAMIMHPDKDKILSHTQPGHDSLYDRATRGFEGAGKSFTPLGKHTIAAYKRLKTVDWILAAQYPEEEALSPIRKATYSAWALVLIGGVLTGAVFWLVTRQLIAPLISITGQIRDIERGEHRGRKVEITTNDEIMELATAFNDLMAKRDEAKKRLQELNEDLESRVAERTAQLEHTNALLQHEIKMREQAQEEISTLNEDLNRRAISLENINRELESFSYSISHDLRAPVRHIKGFINILLEDHADKFEGELKRFLVRISAASGKLEILINDILNLSRVSLAEIRTVPVNLSNMASETGWILRETEPGRNVVFDIEEGVMATGDPALLQLVIQNLLENAWKYSAKNEAALIRFGRIRSGNETVFFVSDNGIGFDMTQADQIFGVFQRLHNSREYEGTGIGLATVQRIIHRLGGRIWAEGKVGEGATFYFALP